MTRSPRLGSSARHWPAAIDGLLDGALVSFAAWTLWYEIALALQFDLRWSGWVFLLGALLLMGLFAVREVRAETSVPAPAEAGEVDEAEEVGDVGRSGLAATAATAATDPGRGRRAGAFDLAWAVGLGCLVLSVLLRDAVGVLPAAVIGIVLVAAAAWHRLRTPAAPTDALLVERVSGVPARQTDHLGAVLVSVGLGVLSLFLVKPDADDVFYVNRAAWVAGHGTAALQDTVFGPDTLDRSSGTGLPTPSVEALQGVAAHMLGVEAATFAYLVYAPLLAVVLGWVTWRLIRAWAPRRQLLVLLGAVLFMLASASGIVGNYSVGRIWQGKVTAYAVLLPLAWLYLTRIGRRLDRRSALLLACAGIAFVGLTTTSALMAPVMLGAALLAALVGRSKALALGGLLFAAAPLVNGVVQVLAPAQVGDGVTHAASASQVFGVAYGTGTAMAVLALVATVVAVRVARLSAAPVVAAAAVVSLAAYLPGVLGVADALTGAGPVVWRVAIAAPLWVFVGLLLAVPGPARVPRAEPWSAAVRTAVLASALVMVVAIPLVSGVWLWSAQVNGRLTSSPQWKVNPAGLADLRAARRLDVAPGLWLMPKAPMEDLAISTAGPFAVVPRDFYLSSLEVPEQQLADRRVLFSLVTRRPVPAPAVATVRGALQRLGVTLACVPGEARGARHVLSEAVGGHLQRVGSMRCHVTAP